MQCLDDDCDCDDSGDLWVPAKAKQKRRKIRSILCTT